MQKDFISQYQTYSSKKRSALKDKAVYKQYEKYEENAKNNRTLKNRKPKSYVKPAAKSETNPFEATKSKLYEHCKQMDTAYKHMKDFRQCENDLRLYSEQNWFKTAHISYLSNYGLPAKYLDSDGFIKKDYLMGLLLKSGNIESFRNINPFFMSNQMRDLFLATPKTPELQFVFSKEHSTSSHFTIRQFVSANINDQVQFFAYDLTFYRGIPKISARITHVINGSLDGTKQLARIDSCGMFDEAFLTENNINYEIPMGMRELYHAIHKNTMSYSNAENYAPFVETSTHIHKTDEEFDLYAAGFHLCFKDRFTNKSKKLGNELSKYNSKPLEIIADANYKLNIATENAGVIPFQLLESKILKMFGLCNCGLTQNMIDIIEEYRKPESTIQPEKIEVPIFKHVAMATQTLNNLIKTK